jgi:peptide/nickel transport system substrate-binding protein
VDFTHVLTTPDEEWLTNTGNAVAAQLRDAGFAVERTILPVDTFAEGWRTHAFSTTSWNHRPLGVQVLALAYRSGEAWNETGYASEAFDAALLEALSIADAEARRAVMARLEQLLRDDGVMIQPFWRTLFNHHGGTLVNAEKHPQHEIHVHKIGFAA